MKPDIARLSGRRWPLVVTRRGGEDPSEVSSPPGRWRRRFRRRSRFPAHYLMDERIAEHVAQRELRPRVPPNIGGTDQFSWMVIW